MELKGPHTKHITRILWPLHKIVLNLIEAGVTKLQQGQNVFAERNDSFESHQRDFNVKADRYGPQPILRMLQQLGNYKNYAGSPESTEHLEIALIDSFCEVVREHPTEYHQTLIKDLSTNLTTAYNEPLATSDEAKIFLKAYLKEHYDTMDIVSLMNVPALLKVLGLDSD